MNDSIQKRMIMEELAAAEELLSRNVSLTTITYGDFVRQALPVLRGIGTGEFDPQQWIAITGHPSIELSVIDETTGEERYRIPPMMGYSDFQEVEEFNIAKVADEAAIMKNESSAAADQSIYDHLSLLQQDEGELMECQRQVIVAINQVFKDHQIEIIPLGEDDKRHDDKKGGDDYEVVGYDLA